MCAAQEELVLAALRIEALQVAKNISQCPSLSTVTPQVLRWVLHLLYASVFVCVRERLNEWLRKSVCVRDARARDCSVRAWVCLSLPIPPPKPTILSVTVNSWPYQHGGCTTTSAVLPPLQSPHAKSLTWLPPRLAANSSRLTPQEQSAAPCLYCACWATCMLPVQRLTWALMWLGRSHAKLNISSWGVIWL